MFEFECKNFKLFNELDAKCLNSRMQNIFRLYQYTTVPSAFGYRNLRVHFSLLTRVLFVLLFQDNKVRWIFEFEVFHPKVVALGVRSFCTAAFWGF